MILTTGMAHPRTLIRYGFVGKLVNVTAAGPRVQGTRVDSLKKQLPAISVYTLSESTDESSAETAPIELTRILKVEVAGWVAHTDAIPVDDAMDNIAQQIEAAIAADYYIGGTCVAQMLESTEMQVLADDGRSDPLIGIVTLTYSVTYRTSQADAAGLDDFITVVATDQIVGGVADTVPESNQFTVQETP